MSIRSASEILASYWDGRLPVDPQKIAGMMGVAVMPSTDPKQSGYYRFNNGSPVIEYNGGEAAVRQRFTIAHELGHHAHGDIDAPRDTPDSFSSQTREPREIAANRFAAALLMPEKVVRYMIFEEGLTNLESLAHRFGVSTVAMRYRLMNLGLI